MQGAGGGERRVVLVCDPMAGAHPVTEACGETRSQLKRHRHKFEIDA